MPNKSKVKGNNFEREVAKFLSNLYKMTFSRMPTSGASGTINDNKALQGDIVIPHSCRQFVIECKCYKKADLLNDCFELSSFSQMFIKQASSSSLPWLLIVKQKSKKPYILFEKTLDVNYPENHFVYKNYVIGEMSAFFKANPDLFN